MGGVGGMVVNFNFLSFGLFSHRNEGELIILFKRNIILKEGSEGEK